MAVPVATGDDVKDRLGRPVRVGYKVRVEGIPDLTEVHAVDPRYGVLVVLIPGRAGQQMGRMVRASQVEVIQVPESV
jgi:hypothetical protein